MTATAAEALELALWLHRVPTRRGALLARPLPEGIGQLLRVAVGARDQVAAAAMITGEDEATILEAVRFYLQQILFHDEADAYRVLGLRPEAPQAQAREHHRLLQQWLHPDRSGGDAWESVYATRINRAWSHLRTPQARANYDALLVDTGPSRSRVSGEHQLSARPVAPAAVQSPRNRTRNVTLLVILGCIGLLVLIALRQERPPQWHDFRPSLAATIPALEAEQAEQADVAPLVATLGTALVDAVAVAPDASSEPEPAFPVAQVTEPSPAVATITTKAMDTPQFRAPPRAPDPELVPISVEPHPEPPTTAVVPPILTMVLAAAEPTAPRQQQPALVIPNAFDRMTQARARARQVSEYLGDLTAAAPPVWNDVNTLHRAQKLRAELHQRLGMPRQVELRWLDPKWRLSADGAWLETGYRVAAERGRLDISFGWREDQLLIRSIDLVPGT